ncbi:MAG: hypothetical protein CVV56_05170 [Tenericutes bacterium HGW-Tenericutes-1]|jgi:hypothetical protein|nr:MAG: hypothetical protein CVV56_05170 [Tenericutes bacterium HGW-Tenericutes-1]
MNVIDQLLRSDPVIKRLTEKYLLSQEVIFDNQGYIQRYFDLYEPKSHLWGNGVYGPKWISTHYTMMELRYMEIDPLNSIYQDALNTLLSHLWKEDGMYNRKTHLDMCIAGMLLSLSTYGKKDDDRNYEMIDYILSHVMTDGGWNCRWENRPSPKISSVHTTLSILESLRDYIYNGYSYRIDEVKLAMNMGIETLLKRNLYQAHQTKTPIHPAMIKSSYPPRWKYDILRALEYLDSINFPLDSRMDDALNIIEHAFKGPFMPKGSQISGLIHFKLEESKYGLFNTLRALKVMKRYRLNVYNKLINMIL